MSSPLFMSSHGELGNKSSLDTHPSFDHVTPYQWPRSLSTNGPDRGSDAGRLALGLSLLQISGGAEDRARDGHDVAGVSGDAPSRKLPAPSSLSRVDLWNMATSSGSWHLREQVPNDVISSRSFQAALRQSRSEDGSATAPFRSSGTPEPNCPTSGLVEDPFWKLLTNTPSFGAPLAGDSLQADTRVILDTPTHDMGVESSPPSDEVETIFFPSTQSRHGAARRGFSTAAQKAPSAGSLLPDFTLRGGELRQAVSCGDVLSFSGSSYSVRGHRGQGLAQTGDRQGLAAAETGSIFVGSTSGRNLGNSWQAASSRGDHYRSASGGRATTRPPKSPSPSLCGGLIPRSASERSRRVTSAPECASLDQYFDDDSCVILEPLQRNSSTTTAPLLCECGLMASDCLSCEDPAVAGTELNSDPATVMCSCGLVASECLVCDDSAAPPSAEAGSAHSLPVEGSGALAPGTARCAFIPEPTDCHAPAAQPTGFERSPADSGKPLGLWRRSATVSAGRIDRCAPLLLPSADVSRGEAAGSRGSGNRARVMMRSASCAEGSGISAGHSRRWTVDGSPLGLGLGGDQGSGDVFAWAARQRMRRERSGDGTH